MPHLLARRGVLVVRMERPTPIRSSWVTLRVGDCTHAEPHTKEPVKSKARFIGLDVHAETIAVAVAEPHGEVRSLGIIPNRAESIRRLIGAVDAAIARVTADGAYDTIAFYETGGCTGRDRCGPTAHDGTSVSDGDHGRALGIKRSRRSSESAAVGGRRRSAIIGRPGWRTPSFGTSRSSAEVFALALPAGE